MYSNISQWFCFFVKANIWDRSVQCCKQTNIQHKTQFCQRLHLDKCQVHGKDMMYFPRWITLVQSVLNLPLCSCKLGMGLSENIFGGFKVFHGVSTGMLKKCSVRRSKASSWSASVIKPLDTYCLISECWLKSPSMQIYVSICPASWMNLTSLKLRGCFHIVLKV